MHTALMVKRLISKGYTQNQIVELVQERGANCTQPSISRILRGAEPGYILGDALRRAYVEICEGAEEQATTGED